MLNNQVLTAREAADYLKLNTQVVEKYFRQGIIPARKVGRQWRISKLALDFWLAPSLAAILPRTFLWQEIFSLGDKIAAETSFSEEKILKTIEEIRRKRGSTRKSRP